MYIGIGPEQGKKVNTLDALGYAAERIVGDKETAEQFHTGFSTDLRCEYQSR